MANLRPNLDKAIFDVLNVASLNTIITGKVVSVFNSFAHPSVAPPFVVFQAMSKEEDYWAFSKRGGQAVYLVKAVTEEAWPKEAATIDTQVDTLLQDATLTIAGYTLVTCRRESDFYLPESVGGKVFQQQGGLYRVVADQS